MATKWRRGGKELAPLVVLLLLRGGTRREGRHLGSGGARNLLLGMPNKKKFEANTYNGHNKSMNITKVRVLNMDN